MRRLLGFDSRLRSASPATREPERRSCLGLCLLQGCRALAAHRPGSTPVPINSPRNVHPGNSFAGDDSNPLVGLATFLPITSPPGRELPRAARCCDCEGLSLRGFVASLQRVDETDAFADLTRSRDLTRPAPCLRFCTVRE